MSAPGWYPDPAGVANRLRYFDGNSWTEDVRDAPTADAPQADSAATVAAPAASRRLWPWLALGVVVVVVAIILANLRPSSPPAGPVETAAPTISAWNESEQPSPTPTPSPSQPSPSPTGKCEQEAEHRRIAPVVANGRMSVGVMSMPVPSGWDGPVSEYSTVYGAAAHGYELNIEGSWYNNLKIGPTNFANPPGLETQARLLVSCLSEGSGMSLYTSPDKLTLSKVSISGHPGVQLDAWFSWNVERLKTKGSLIRVIVVDTSDGPYYFLAEATKERADVVNLAKKISTQLTVS
jgi:hypothetical protein